MNRNDLRELLPDYVRGLLAPEETARVERALAESQELRREFDDIRRYYGAMKTLGTVRAPDDFLDKVHARIDREPLLSRLGRLILKPLPVKLPIEIAGLAVAAVLILVVYRPSEKGAVPPLQIDQKRQTRVHREEPKAEATEAKDIASDQEKAPEEDPARVSRPDAKRRPPELTGHEAKVREAAPAVAPRGAAEGGSFAPESPAPSAHLEEEASSPPPPDRDFAHDDLATHRAVGAAGGVTAAPPAPTLSQSAAPLNSEEAEKTVALQEETKYMKLKRSAEARARGADEEQTTVARFAAESDQIQPPAPIGKILVTLTGAEPAALSEIDRRESMAAKSESLEPKSAGAAGGFGDELPSYSVRMEALFRDLGARFTRTTTTPLSYTVELPRSRLPSLVRSLEQVGSTDTRGLRRAAYRGEGSEAVSVTVSLDAP